MAVRKGWHVKDLRRTLRKQRWLIPVGQVTGVLSLGVLLTWLVVQRVGVGGSAVAVACLLLPALVALGFSGRLTEISAGGVTARFREASRQPVNNLTVKAERLISASKGQPLELDGWMAVHELDYLRPVVLELRLGRQYDPTPFAYYIRKLSASYPRFAFVVVVKESGEHVCHIAASLMLTWVGRDDWPSAEQLSRVNSFLIAVSDDHIKGLLRAREIRTETATQSTGLAEALRSMSGTADEALLVLDEKNHPYGILERTTAMTELILALAN